MRAPPEDEGCKEDRRVKIAIRERVKQVCGGHKKEDHCHKRPGQRAARSVSQT